jgi:hypothetical protein
VDALVARGATCVTVLDVAGTALQRARARLGAQASQVSWIEADVTGEWDVPRVDIWHDRAAFHFLVEREDRERYVERLRQALGAGGHAVMATFALEGPTRCSGLPVMRYSPETLLAELGAGFRIVTSFQETHVTPAGSPQTFSWALLKLGTGDWGLGTSRD